MTARATGRNATPPQAVLNYTNLWQTGPQRHGPPEKFVTYLLNASVVIVSFNASVVTFDFLTCFAITLCLLGLILTYSLHPDRNVTGRKSKQL